MVLSKVLACAPAKVALAYGLCLIFILLLSCAGGFMQRHLCRENSDWHKCPDNLEKSLNGPRLRALGLSRWQSSGWLRYLTGHTEFTPNSSVLLFHKEGVYSHQLL